jgi:wobble nucleotide-excising tRNase
MPTPTIDKIRHLKNCGVFSDVNVASFPHDFKRYNLIYGFNGCGKTTLSRILSMLSENRIAGNLPDGAEFSFSLSDGSTPAHGSLDSALNRYIAVFNEDYVDQSLTWKEGTARPIIYLGAEQAEMAKQLGVLEGSQAEANATEILKASQFGFAERAFSKLCTDAARLISEQLGLGRTYNATSLKADYVNNDLTPDDGLTDDEIRHLRTTITRADLPDKIPTVVGSLKGNDAHSSVERALKALVSDITIASLQRRKDALQWVDQGLHLHIDEPECLFCGNELSEQRVLQLREALQSGFEQFSRNLDAASASSEHFFEACRSFREQLNQAFEPLSQYREPVDRARAALSSLLIKAEDVASCWSDQIASKRAKPDESFVVALLDFANWDDEVLSAIEALNSIISENNQAIENFESERQRSKQRLKRHYLFYQKEEFEASEKALAGLKSDYQIAVKALSDILEDITALRANLRTHGPAADQLNKLLHSYLGHKHISVEAIEEGYRICRDGKESKKPLSEGEKTAIAFCYFLTALNSEGRKIKDLVVVLDDPISSLDARAMTHVVSMVRQNFSDPTQLFIMTHNLDFMREMKKWLSNKRDKGIAEFYFIETGISAQGSRSSVIIEMPKLVREYESEYHYLYSLVKSLSEDPISVERFAYLMPNAIRKVLDIFLAFKVPGSSGLESKVDKIIGDYTALDNAKIKAMERLAQLESHSDNIGDVVTFSAYTLHQVTDAASCLMELINTVDPNHKRAMDKLC